MNELTALADRLIARYRVAETGSADTPVAGVRLYHSVRPAPRAPWLYSSGIVIIVTGSKTGFLDGRRFVYDSANYLALGLPLAMECETLASPEAPLFAIYLRVDPLFLRDVARQMALAPEPPAARSPAVAAAPFSAEMADAVARLMRQLCSESDAAILGEATRREIV